MTKLVDILEIVHGQIICVTYGQRKVFSSNDALQSSDLYKNHIVSSISSEGNSIVLELQQWETPITDMDSDWVRKYKEQNGSEPSFF